MDTSQKRIKNRSATFYMIAFDDYVFDNNTFVFVNDLQGLLGTSVMICNYKVSFELF